MHQDKQPATYAATLRPIGYATVPKGHTAIGTHEGARWGTATYPLPLDPEVAKAYSLLRIPTEEDRFRIIASIVERMCQYAAEHLELHRDDQGYLPSIVGMHLDKMGWLLKRADIIDDVVFGLKEIVLDPRDFSSDADRMVVDPDMLPRLIKF